jgi:hypothetical protein
MSGATRVAVIFSEISSWFMGRYGGGESLPHEHARDGPSRHESRVSATDLLESVRLVELDASQRGLDLDTRGPLGDPLQPSVLKSLRSRIMRLPPR